MSTPPPKLTGDWLSCAPSIALMAMFEHAGYRARFVGGVVRNALMGEPVGDLDVATDALPHTVMSMAEKSGFKAVATGIDHGTVTVIVEGQAYEITTLRVDMQTDGRHADVAFTKDWAQDAARRDFTMNALYVDPDGTLFDPLGGYDDLRSRRVRFIGNPVDRIKEDYLRILRFFRFCAQYGKGDVDREGLEACVLLHKGLQALSAERIRAEFSRLLLMPQVTAVLEIMFAHGLILPLSARVPHLTRFKNWLELEGGLERSPSWIDRLGALFVLVPEDASHLSRKLRLSNGEKRALGRWVRDGEINQMPGEKQAQLLFYKLGDDYQTAIAIDWVLSNADVADPKWHKLYDLPTRWQRPRFPLKGQDLLDSGMAAGPAIGKKLLELERAWIESDFTLAAAELLNQRNARS